MRYILMLYINAYNLRPKKLLKYIALELLVYHAAMQPQHSKPEHLILLYFSPSLAKTFVKPKHIRKGILAQCVLMTMSLKKSLPLY